MRKSAPEAAPPPSPRGGADNFGAAVRFLLSIRSCLLALLMSMAVVAHASEAAPVAADPALEARVTAITTELRCLVCQNQTIADSHADLAVDLRRQVRQMVAEGRSKQQVLDYMTARYGDFVLYRPPLKDSTALLWFGPAVLLLGGLGTLALVLRRRARLPHEQFDPDEPDAVPPV